jgi:GR25 family glycosyltransferase involved in LPS biosynthesis
MENIKKYFDSIDIIYWINLDRSTDRRKNMEEILKELPVKNERISAVDGKTLPSNEILSHFILNKNSASTTEYACLLSHLNTIKVFSETNYKYALIFEDDISLEFVKYWDKKISDIIKNAPEDWEILLLNYTTNNEIQNDYELVHNNGIYSTQAYIIKNSSVKEFIKNFYNNGKFDLTKYNGSPIADHFLFHAFKTYSYKYAYFTYSSINDSTIHPEHLGFHESSKQKIIARWEKKRIDSNEDSKMKLIPKLENKEHFYEASKNNNLIYYILFLILILLILLILRLNYQI